MSYATTTTIAFHQNKKETKRPSNIGLELGIIQRTVPKQEMVHRGRRSPLPPGQCNATKSTHTQNNSGIILDSGNSNERFHFQQSLYCCCHCLPCFFSFFFWLGATLCFPIQLRELAYTRPRNRIRKNKFGADTNGNRRINLEKDYEGCALGTRQKRHRIGVRGDLRRHGCRHS